MTGRLGMLVQIALRNLRASPINLIIGALILIGTFIFVVIGAVLDSLNDSMAKSVVGSLAGHVQVYSAKAKDDLALYGQMGSDPDLGAVTSFPTIKEALEKVENVKTVVPMGVSGAIITSGNIVDVTLERLRNLTKARDGQPVSDVEIQRLTPEQVKAAIESERSHIRQIIKVLEGDARKAAQELMNEKAVDQETMAALNRVSTDEFWNQFDADPYASLEFLENKIAPQVTDAQMLFLRYVGTDLDTFSQSFDRLQIIDGTAVPKGQRGFLVAKYFYEDSMKLKNARRFDKIKEALDANRTIASDDELKRFVKENRSQTKEIVLQLDGDKSKVFTSKLQKNLGSTEADLSALLSAFFDTTDETFRARYDFFYQELAPMLQLYRVRVGDSLTIKAFSRSGYMHAVNVRVYGTFAFKGLEKSPLAGTTNLMDLMSFRDLYGYLSADKVAELKEIQQATGSKTVSRENAEAELFGGDDATTIVAEATPGIIDPDKELSGLGKKFRQEDLIKRVYTQDEINDGVVLNAAVILKDPSKIEATMKAIRAVDESQKLGVKVVSWQQASGFLGQLILVFRVLLFIGVAIIFVIAMIIINNAMMMATMQRTQTIGTMRAIGAQRYLILSMVLVETIVLGIVFGGLGVAISTIFMKVWGSVGTAAPNDIAYFFFSGPKLYPTLDPRILVVAVTMILIVTIVSTLYPAILATRISPLRAMQADE